MEDPIFPGEWCRRLEIRYSSAHSNLAVIIDKSVIYQWSPPITMS
jgi:hypothetical protein